MPIFVPIRISVVKATGKLHSERELCDITFTDSFRQVVNQDTDAACGQPQELPTTTTRSTIVSN